LGSAFWKAPESSRPTASTSPWNPPLLKPAPPRTFQLSHSVLFAVSCNKSTANSCFHSLKRQKWDRRETVWPQVLHWVRAELGLEFELLAHRVLGSLATYMAPSPKLFFPSVTSYAVFLLSFSKN
jgi:hypothetical protein